MAPAVDVLVRLDVNDVEAVGALAARAARHDGTAPLSEQALLRLHRGSDPSIRHLIVRDQDLVVGYACVETLEGSSWAGAELVVDPTARRRGVGSALLAAIRSTSPQGKVRVWAHGDSAAAAALADQHGLVRVRTLWQLRRSLSEPIPAPALPANVTVRTFQPGQDDDAWLALNAAAFADHPEQGRWTLQDLHQRMAEEWFDAAGFYLAERFGRLVGFHWTKVHRGDAADTGPIGEVYVVGVLAAERGTGLGRALTEIGLRHLQRLGLAQVQLYVDADNRAAVRLYESLGFSRWSADVLFSA